VDKSCCYKDHKSDYSAAVTGSDFYVTCVMYASNNNWS